MANGTQKENQLGDRLRNLNREQLHKVEIAKGIFPVTFSQAFESDLDEECVLLLRSHLSEVVNLSEISSQKELLDKLDDFFNKTGNDKEEFYESRMTISIGEPRENFFRTYANDLIICDDVKEMALYALCMAYVRLEEYPRRENIENFYMPSINKEDTREEKLAKLNQRIDVVTPIKYSNVMRTFSLLDKVLLLDELNYPSCIKRRGGTPS